MIKIDEDLTAKINMADYKFSLCEKDKIYSPAWIAPEGLLYFNEVLSIKNFIFFILLHEALKKRSEDINKKSADMWSFAVVLWELFTKEVPFGQYSPMQCGLLVNRLDYF